MRSQKQSSAAGIDLDAILVEIGERGRYQLAQYALLGVFVVLTCVPNLSYIFTTAQLDYRYVMNMCGTRQNLGLITSNTQLSHTRTRNGWSPDALAQLASFCRTVR